MLAHTREEDIALMTRAAGSREPGHAARPSPLQTLIPAFMISELRAAFIIGFVIFMPFLVIDLVVVRGADVDGHDDAAAGDDLAAVQDPALHPRGRLGPDHHRTRASYARRLSGHQRRPGHRPAGPARRREAVARPSCITALVVGFAVSLLPVDHADPGGDPLFVPKASRSAIALLVSGHWMISEMVAFTNELFARIPGLLGGLTDR